MLHGLSVARHVYDIYMSTSVASAAPWRRPRSVDVTLHPLAMRNDHTHGFRNYDTYGVAQRRQNTWHCKLTVDYNQKMKSSCEHSRVLLHYTFIVIQVAALVESQTDDVYLQTYPQLNETDDRTPLYFALMLSFGGDYRSIGALPGVQIALDYINNEHSILPGYTLHYTLTDSKVILIL